MGGRSPAQIVSTVATGLSTPFVATAALAKEAIGSDNSAKVDAVPILGTVSQGVTAQGNIAGTTGEAIASGDFSEVRKEGVQLAKYGAVAAAAYGGAAYVGAEAIIPAAQFGDMVAKRGIDVGTLSGAAASYFGNDLASYGIDVQSFFPKDKPAGSFDYGGSTEGYFQSPYEFASVEGNGAWITVGLGIALLVTFILVVRKRK